MHKTFSLNTNAATNASVYQRGCPIPPYPMIRRRLPLSTLTVLSGPIDMLRLELLSSSDAFLLLKAAP